MPAADPVADPIFDALGNPVRRQIVRHVAERPRSVTELAGLFDISRPAISRHLAQLVDAGLLTYEARGTNHFYALREDGLDAARAWFDDFWDAAEARIRLVAANVPERDT